MCLAVPGRIIASEDDAALVDFCGNRVRVSTVLTPAACVGDWVLVHAGFAISEISEQAALENWDCLRGEIESPSQGGEGDSL
jgi:hydrogenase expression/formation protein HypC